MNREFVMIAPFTATVLVQLSQCFGQRFLQLDERFDPDLIAQLRYECPEFVIEIVEIKQLIRIGQQSSQAPENREDRVAMGGLSRSVFRLVRYSVFARETTGSFQVPVGA